MEENSVLQQNDIAGNKHGTLKSIRDDEKNDKLANSHTPTNFFLDEISLDFTLSDASFYGSPGLSARWAGGTK